LKIAIAKEGDMVAQHFGQCKGYDLFTIENGAVTGSEYIESPGHSPGVLPKLLADHGANVVLAGGMGPAAVQLFTENNIEVFVGVTGEIKVALENYLSDRLEKGSNICNH